MASPASTASPTLSIVLTVYNMRDCLAPCLDDLLGQTYSDFELICVDDGSTDGSDEVLASYSDRFPTFRLVTQENSGPAAARNAGMDLAKGEYLMLLDSDDRFEPTLLETMVTQIRHAQADIVVCRADEFDHTTGNRRPAGRGIRNELLPPAALSATDPKPFDVADASRCLFSALMGWPWDKIYRTALIEEHGLLFPNLPNAEDFPFVFRALCEAKRIAVIDQILIHHRIKRAGSTSNSRLASPMSFYEGIELLKRDLKADPALWVQVEWGYLNWALDYACWNIESLPAGTPERAQLVDALLNGGMPALELEKRPPQYFSLHPDDLWCLRRLKRELETGKPCRKSLWEYLWVACHRVGEVGIGGLLKQFVALVRSR